LEPKLLENTANGVLSTNFEVGFFNNSKWSMRFSFQANYFTKLMRLKLENTAIYQTPSNWE
jgi:hypothetical protein